MTLTFGRAVLPDPSSVSSSGAFVTFSGMAYSSASTAANRAAEVQMLEAQVLGMVGNPDEDAFPVVWSAESKWDGFYTEIDASWDWVNDGSGRVSVANWSITGRKVTDFGRPLVETTVAGAYRTTFPGSASGIPYGVSVGSSSGTNIDSFTGSDGFLVVVGANPTTSSVYSTWSTYVAPADYYKGATTLEVFMPDSNWYALVGRDFPAEATQWRLSNSNVRFTGELSTGYITPARYDSTAVAWEACAAVTGNVDVGGTAIATPIASGASNYGPAIMRNDSAAVVLKTYNGAYGNTISLRAGTSFAEVIRFNTASTKFGLRFVSTTTSTALATANSGVYQSSADANGNYVVLGSSPVVTNDTTNGRTLLTAATTAANAHYIGVLSTLSGSAATAQNVQFLYAISGSRRVVAR